jgi:hypothetical protein
VSEFQENFEITLGISVDSWALLYGTRCTADEVKSRDSKPASSKDLPVIFQIEASSRSR